jgi:hypothetical protein
MAHIEAGDLVAIAIFLVGVVTFLWTIIDLVRKGS